MPVTLKDVEHIAALAKLRFTEAEKEMFTHQLNAILTYVEQLNRIDTSGIKPLSHVIEYENVFRDDVVRPGLTRDDALNNAPSSDEEFFKVPKVIGDR